MGFQTKLCKKDYNQEVSKDLIKGAVRPIAVSGIGTISEGVINGGLLLHLLKK